MVAAPNKMEIKLDYKNERMLRQLTRAIERMNRLKEYELRLSEQQRAQLEEEVNPDGE